MFPRLTPGIVAFLLLVAAAPWPAVAAPTIRVGTGTAASCTDATLGKALATADAKGGGTIQFRCGPQPVTILLFEPITIPDNTMINGGGLITLETILIDNRFQAKTIIVEAGASVLLTNLTVRLGFTVIDNAGELIVQNSSVAGSVSHNVVNTGTLALISSSICCELQDVFGGGVANAGALLVYDTIFSDSFGGGISNVGWALITNSRFLRNRWEHGDGGAIENHGTMIIHDTTFSENLSVSRGGAINNQGTLAIYRSTFSGNVASRGGAIANTGELSVFDSTITGNSAGVLGGGVYTCCGRTTTLVRTLVTGNTPDDTVEEP